MEMGTRPVDPAARLHGLCMGSATRELCSITLFSSILDPHSAFNSEIPSDEPPSTTDPEQGYDSSAALAERGAKEVLQL